MTHTPTPWKRYDSPLNSWIGNSSNGEIVCDRSEAGYDQHWDGNAAFIVKACNAHDELVAALELWQTRIGCGCGELPCKNCSDAFYKAEQALAKAEKGT